MALNGPMHWHEGLFLQPHHLQYMQRHLLGRVAGERRLSWAYPYGLIEAKLSSDELENMRVRFDRLRVVMPSGTMVDVPDGADLPALDIKTAFESRSGAFTVSLGIPLWYDRRANAIEQTGEGDWRVKRIYRVHEAEVVDENTGDNPQPIPVRGVNARLLLDDDDRSDLEVLPLLRISPGVGEEVGTARQDPNFIPACLVLAGSPTLRDLVRDLANQVEASRKELVLQMTRGGFSVDAMRGVQFEQMLRLRTLNHYAGRLMPLVQAPSIPTFDVYLELRGLLGELAALQPDRDPYAAADYNHDAPGVCFGELCAKIRALLKGMVAATYLQLRFTRDVEQKLYAATLTDEHLTSANEYFLGIRTKDDPRALAALVEDSDKFKLMPASLSAQRVWGVRLAEERHPPLELPAQSGLHYFRLMRAESRRMWERIEQEKTLAARWPGAEAADFEITLYMTVVEQETPR